MASHTSITRRTWTLVHASRSLGAVGMTGPDAKASWTKRVASSTEGRRRHWRSNRWSARRARSVAARCKVRHHARRRGPNKSSNTMVLAMLWHAARLDGTNGDRTGRRTVGRRTVVAGERHDVSATSVPCSTAWYGCDAIMAWKVRPVMRQHTWASVPTYRAVHRWAPHAWSPWTAHRYVSGSPVVTTVHVRPSHRSTMDSTS